MTDAATTDRYCVLNGTRFRYRDEGTGPPVILVHGWTLDLEMWDSQVASLQSALRIIRYDRRGFGLSSGYPSIDQDRVDLDAVCAHLALGRVGLVGMSQGARAVTSFAATAPSRVCCVVLDGPPDLVATALADDEPVNQYAALARTRGIGAFRREWVKHPLVRLITSDPRAHQALRSMIERYPGKDLAAPTATVEPAAAPLQLETFTVQTLIITGEHDIASRVAAADLLADRLPHAERAIISGAGHLPNLDNPGLYNKLLSAFLTRHATGPT